MRLNRFALTLGMAAAVAGAAACGEDDDPIGPDPNQQVELFTAIMSGANERPTPNSSTAGGSGWLRIYSSRPDAGAAFVVDSMKYELSWSGLSANATGAHIHAPANTENTAGVVHNLSAPAQTSATLPGKITTPSNTAVTLTQLADHIRAGNAYFNVHAPAPYAGGEIRGQLVSAD